MAAELDRLVAEMKQLRTDFARISDVVVGLARQQTNEAADKVRRAAEDTWSEARGRAEGVAKKIEDQPLVATAIAFGVGMLLGMLFLGRKR